MRPTSSLSPVPVFSLLESISRFFPGRLSHVKCPDRPNEAPRFSAFARGFTLVETALALLAISMSLLAIFGLGRLGLDAVRESENDRRCVMLADAVFEALRETNARLVDQARADSDPDAWYRLWGNLIQAQNLLPFPPVAEMCSTRLDPNISLMLNTSLARAFREDQISLDEWNPRYTLLLSGGEENADRTIIQVTLAIYPDGDTYSSPYRLFHTTLSNPGGLP